MNDCNYWHSLITLLIAVHMLFIMEKFRINKKQQLLLYICLNILMFVAAFKLEWPFEASPILALLSCFALSFVCSEYQDGRLIFTWLFIITTASMVVTAGYTVGSAMGCSPLLDAFFRLILGFLILFCIEKKYMFFYRKVQEGLDHGWWKLCGISAGLLGLYYYLQKLDSQENILHIGLDIAVIAVIFLFHLLIIWIFQQFFIQLTLQHDNKMLRFQEETLQQQVKIRENMCRNVENLSREMHLYGEMIVERLEQKQEGAALEVAKTFVHSVEENSYKRYCEFPILNSIVGYYASRAAESQIQMDVHFRIEEDLEVPEIELGIVFSNALENAMKACRVVPDAALRKIEIFCIIQKDILIKIANSFYKEIKFDEKGIPCAQEKGHGIGSHSIISFVEAHKGTVKYSIQGNQFVFQVFIPENREA